VLEKYCDLKADAEVIVVDSSDAPLSSAFFLAYTSYYRIPNNGPSFARNYGASKATKKWLLFCDGDDIPNPFILKDAVALIPKTANAVFFKYKKEDDELILHASEKLYNGYDKPQLLHIEPITDPVYFLQKFYPVHALLVQAQIFNKTRFNEKMWFIEDVRLYIELALLKDAKLMYCSDDWFISFHRMFKNRKSLSTSNETLFWEGVCENFKLITEKSSLKPASKFKLIKLVLLNFHSVNKDLQKSILQQNKKIFNYFLGLPHLLRNRVIFNTLTTFTRIGR
jgi:glycosyltransferase involved in cell wall biosynthesis